MATEVGANIVEEDLTFGFDSGYGVADNSTATRFYPGEPTVNYVSDSPTQGGWSGGIDVLDSSQKKFKCHISNFAANPGAGWRAFTWDMNAHSGSDVTISLDFETVGPNGTMAWIMVGQTSTYTNNSSGAGQYMGYSATSERTQKTTTSKERVTWTGTIGSTGTASQPSGHIGFTIWINSGISGNQDAYVILSNVQIEKKNHATPFVNGTRSSTASLIDLKRTTNIDVSNISFDSSGQPSFDETDDHITGVLPMDGLGAAHTIEMIFSCSVNQGSIGSRKDPFSIGNSSTHQYSALDVNSGNMNWYFYSRDTTFTNSPLMVANKFYHMVLSYAGGASNNTNKKVWLNGVQQTLSAGSSEIPLLPNNPSFSVGRDRGRNTAYWPGEIPVWRVYQKALTQDEAKQNYNAYKKRFDL